MRNTSPPIRGKTRRTHWPRGYYMKIKSGKILRGLMETQNRSFADVGRYAGVDRSFIWQLASGARSTCRPVVAVRIAELLAVPVDFLFTPTASPSGGGSDARQGRRVA